MAKFVSIFVAIILSVIFVVSLLVGILDLQIQNNAVGNVAQDSKIQNLTLNLENSLVTAKRNADRSSDQFTNSTVTTSGVIPFITAVGGIWSVFRNTIYLGYNVIAVYIGTELFGNNPVIGYIVGGIAAIFMLIIISAVVYWISRGEGG